MIRLFRREEFDADMSAEMRAHIEEQTQRNVAAGMPPDDARAAAHRQFGGVAQMQERARDARSGAWVEQTIRDVRYGLRQLARSPGFAVVALASLAIGIGATSAVFSVVNELMLKPLTVPQPLELVRFKWAGDIDRNHIAGSFRDIDRDARHGHVGATFTFLAFQRFRENNQSLDGLFAHAKIGGHAAVIDGQAEIVGAAEYVSGDYFAGLKIGAAQGRTIAPLDDRLEAPPVAMISHAYWMQRFGGDPSVLGKTIFVNAMPVTIIGITPPEFRGTNSFGHAPALFIPLAFLDQLNPDAANIATTPGYRWLFEIMGRLKPGVTSAQATANLAAIFRQSTVDGSAASMGHAVDEKDIGADFPQLSLEQGDNGSDQIRRSQGQKLTLLFALMGLVLLTACTNLASLLLVRGTARRREIAVRLALGAGRIRLIRQVLTESVLLAAGGGLLGLPLALWGTGWLAAMLGFADIDHVALDARVLGFVAVVSLLTGLFFGLAPAMRATKLDLNSEFQGGPRTIGTGGSALRLGRWLMIAQVALSFVVLASAGLFLLTLHNLRTADVGFARDHLLLFRLDAAPAGYPREKIAGLFERIAGDVRALPGVSAAAFSSVPVVAGSGEGYGVHIPGSPLTAGDRPPAAAVNEVGGDFFAAFNLPPILGRTFELRDDSSAAAVAVINQTMAEKFFPGEDPLGRHFTAGRGDREIVGVVPDIRYENVRQEIPPTAYAPFAQAPAGSANFAVRSTIAPAILAASVRRVVGTIDSKLPVANVRTQEDELERLLADERMFARLSLFLGGLALTLVCIGLYGLTSYAVLRRTREIGVRMALGAMPRRVLGTILHETLTLVSIGVMVGILGTCWAARAVAGMMYGFSPTDPRLFAAVALLLLAVATIACLVPARRAAKIDPVTALRAD